jgi:hypothetical protein
MIEITIKDFPPQPCLSVISNDFKLSLTDSLARSLLRALSQALEEPQVCGIRGMCALYPQNKVAYHDEGAADPGVVVCVREE